MRAETDRINRNTDIFSAVIILLMVLKMSVLLFLAHDDSNIYYYASTEIDLALTIGVFIYSLEKIKRITNGFNTLKLDKCYMLMHFFAVIVLGLTWTVDMYLYIMIHS